MEPTWQSDDGSVQLYLGDCLDVIPRLTGVDAVVTDPPYGIGFKYENAGDRDKDYPGGYVNWMAGVVSTWTAILPAGAPSFVWQSQKRIIDFSAMFPEKHRILVSAKTMGQIFPGCPMQYRWDPVVVFWNGKGKAFGNGAYDFILSQNSAEYGDSNSIEREHPCPRPLGAVTHVLEKWTTKDWTVLDPFCGSATTGVACIRNGRRFIGIEREPKYFDVACRRLKDAMGMEIVRNGVTQKRMFGQDVNGVMPV